MDNIDKKNEETSQADSTKPKSAWPQAGATAATSEWARLSNAGASYASNKKEASGAVPSGCCPLLVNGQFTTKKSWRKRHPILFWLFVIVLLGGVYYAGQISVADGFVRGTKLGVINVDDMILESKDTVEWIEKLRSNKEVKGAILQINSPGGAVAPSQDIYNAVKRLALTKPVVVSMGSMATSGGYYIAMGGHEIFAMPSTLTANIGVRLEIPNFEKLMDTVGIGTTILTTGEYKAAGTSSRKMTPEEEAYLQTLINDMHMQFVEAIAENREMSLEDVMKLADGRAMTGRQALDVGLVDYLGSTYEAKALLEKRCGLSAKDSFTYVEGPEKPQETWRNLLGAVFEIGTSYQRKTGQTQFYY